MDIASVGGPVATVIGAFGHDPSEARIYPPILRLWQRIRLPGRDG